jgi:glycosyltransferase involved in cell wall biosynthesis
MVEQLVVASPGGWNFPSMRYRLGPLAHAGPWPMEVVSAGSFPTKAQIHGLLERAEPVAALVLQRVMPSASDLDRLRKGYGALLFDIDDAIYATPPDFESSRLSTLPKQVARLVIRGSARTSVRKRPLAQTLRQVDVCVAGNAILADFARQFAQRVVEIPTTVDPVSSLPRSREEPPVLVWIGLPDSLKHLGLVREPLKQLSREFDFRLRIVSSEPWRDSPVAVEFVPWSPDTEHAALLSSSVGLAPLTDDPWTRGKCAFRSIQYGGHGVPTVASPVGITDRVVLHGVTGFLARSRTEWINSLGTLLDNPSLVGKMGESALEHIRNHYSDYVAVRRWKEVLESL